MGSSAGSVSTFSSALDRVGRTGGLRLRFERRGAATVLAGCRYTVPLQVLAPVALDGPAAAVSILNPTGGLVGGDELAIDVVAGAGAHAVLTTPSATKVYRTSGAPAVQAVTLRLGPGAVVEYVPDHTIPFPGAAFRQTVRVEVGEAARLVLVDAFAVGRIARGEAWRFAWLESALRVRDAGGWLLRDGFRLRGDPDWGGLGLTEGRDYVATVLVLGEAALSGFEDELAVLAAARPDVDTAGGALPRGGWLVRCLAASAPALVDTVERVWALARRHLLDAPPLPLRK